MVADIFGVTLTRRFGFEGAEENVGMEGVEVSRLIRKKTLLRMSWVMGQFLALYQLFMAKWWKSRIRKGTAWSRLCLLGNYNILWRLEARQQAPTIDLV